MEEAMPQSWKSNWHFLFELRLSAVTLLLWHNESAHISSDQKLSHIPLPPSPSHTHHTPWHTRTHIITHYHTLTHNQATSLRWKTRGLWGTKSWSFLLKFAAATICLGNKSVFQTSKLHHRICTRIHLRNKKHEQKEHNEITQLLGFAREETQNSRSF